MLSVLHEGLCDYSGQSLQRLPRLLAGVAVSAEGKDPTLQQPPVTTASEKAPAAGEAQKYAFYQL